MNLEKTSTRIYQLLTKHFAPVLLEVIDESAKHIGHAGYRPGGETHFRVKIISAAFAHMPKVAQHRAIYQVLDNEMKEGGVHALTLEVHSVQEEK